MTQQQAMSALSELHKVRPLGERSVFILGAGFSRAISGAMPLTDELGNECLSRIPDRYRDHVPDRFEGGLFEAYLSTLAVDQPYFDTSRNLFNRSIFDSFTSAVAHVLAAAQYEALQRQPPDWLAAFTILSHVTRATVVTFNYDTLLECLVASPVRLLGDPDVGASRDGAVPWVDLTEGQPPWPPTHLHWGGKPRDTLRLLKLHGSINWYWTPGDRAGATLAMRDLPGAWVTPTPYDDDSRARLLPGRVPFIVPPVLAKDSLYAVPYLHEIWQRARTELLRADAVYLVGYSMPTADITTSALLRDALVSGKQSIVVADLDPGPVVDRLRRLGIPGSQITSTDTGNSVPSLVDLCCSRQSWRVVNELKKNADVASQLVVSWGALAHAAVIGVHLESPTQLVLQLDTPQKDLRAAARSRSTSEPPAATVSDIAASAAETLVVLSRDKKRQYIVEARHYQEFANSHDTWQVLRAAGMPPN